MLKPKILNLIVTILFVILSGFCARLVAQDIDSLFTVYHNSKGTVQERTGEALLKALEAHQYNIDSSYYSATSQAEKGLILVKSTLDYYFNMIIRIYT